MDYGTANIQKMINGQDREFQTDPRFLRFDTRIDVFLCPPKKGREFPHREYHVHYKVLPGRQPVVCLTTFGKECPVCAVNSRLFSAKNDLTAQAISKEIYRRASFYYNVIPFLRLTPLPQPKSHASGKEVRCGAIFAGNPAKADDVPAVKIYRCGIKVKQAIQGSLNFNGDIFDPACGNIVALEKVAQGSDNENTTVMMYPDKMVLSDKLFALLDNMYDLDAVLTEMERPAAELKTLVEQKVAEAYAARQAVAMTPVGQTVTVPFNFSPSPLATALASTIPFSATATATPPVPTLPVTIQKPVGIEPFVPTNPPAAVPVVPVPVAPVALAPVTPAPAVGNVSQLDEFSAAVAASQANKR